MNVTEIPFNRYLGMRQTQDGSGLLLELDDSPSYLNHVGTVHASAQLALAEATSGDLLLRALPELAGQAVAVVRRVEAKFRNPMRGKISSRGVTTVTDVQQSAGPLSTKGRAIISVTVEIVDQSGAVGLLATLEWFAQKLPPSS